MNTPKEIHNLEDTKDLLFSVLSEHLTKDQCDALAEITVENHNKEVTEYLNTINY